MQQCLEIVIAMGAKLSIIVPVYNEELGLLELFRRLSQAMDGLAVSEVECLLVSDGSVDDSNKLIAVQVATDRRFQGILLARNFGHQAAVSVGLEKSLGDFVVIIDGDLQDPPEIIGSLLAAMNGADVAYAVRTRRKEGFLRKSMYAGFYRLLRRVADIDIPLDTGDFCCMRRSVVDAMLLLPERNRFVRGIRAWVGFRQVGVGYEREARFAGEPRYTLRKLMRLASDGLFGFSSLPVKVMQVLGFAVSVISLLVAAFYFFWYMWDRSTFPSGFATLTISIWFIAGVQLLFMGFIGEYLIRTFDETRQRPIAIVAEHLRHGNDVG